MLSNSKDTIACIGRALHRWRTYHRFRRELFAASDRTLAELGTRRSEIDNFAHECAQRGAEPNGRPRSGTSRALWPRRM